MFLSAKDLENLISCYSFCFNSCDSLVLSSRLPDIFQIDIRILLTVFKNPTELPEIIAPQIIHQERHVL